jgi:predicted SprT family Zn-dependent metalloprotease
MDSDHIKIFIGAKIDQDDENKLLGTMAHEFCHLAMQMLFKNEAKPYDKNDNEGIEKFKMLNKKFIDQIK